MDLEQQKVKLSELHIDRAYLSSSWVKNRDPELTIYFHKVKSSKSKVKSLTSTFRKRIQNRLIKDSRLRSLFLFLLKEVYHGYMRSGIPLRDTFG